MLSRLMHRRGRRRGDSGFTLLELSVASFIIIALLTALLPLYVSAKGTMLEAKQRQSATALATQVLEQLRALPYELVTGGLNSADLTGDANIVGGRFKPAYNGSIDEEIPTNASVNLPPLFPHRASPAPVVAGVTYSVATYVTEQAATDPEQYFLTVLVEWASAATGNETKRVVLRSKLFTPEGCSTASRVYSGPCQAYLYGSASATQGGISVRPVVEGQAPLEGVDMVRGGLTLPGLNSSFQVEQTVGASGSASTSGAQLETSSATSRSGAVAVANGVDTDPAADSPMVDTALTGTQDDATLSADSALSTGSFRFKPGAADAGSSTTTVAADVLHNCYDSAMSALDTDQPCASGSVGVDGQPATAELVLATVGVRNLVFPLASVAKPSTPTRTHAARYVAPGAAACTTASGAGCTASAVSRTIGTSLLGGLPSRIADDLGPVGLGDNLVSLTGYADKASVEASASGPAGSAPTVTAGSLSYWNGVGYTVEALAGAAAGTRTVPDVSITYKTGAEDVTVTISTQLTVATPPAAATPTGAAPCAVACTSEVALESPVSTSFTYTIFKGSAQIANFVVEAGFGRAIASSTFKAAPSA